MRGLLEETKRDQRVQRLDSSETCWAGIFFMRSVLNRQPLRTRPLKPLTVVVRPMQAEAACGVPEKAVKSEVEQRFMSKHTWSLRVLGLNKVAEVDSGCCWTHNKPDMHSDLWWTQRS